MPVSFHDPCVAQVYRTFVRYQEKTRLGAIPNGLATAVASPYSRRMPRRLDAAAILLASFAISSATFAATPPAGFEDRPLVASNASTGASVPVAVAYEPGSGALFVLEKGSGSAQGTARVRRRDAAT